MTGQERALRVIAAARELLHVPFRLYGRDERGLDCVGLVALALARSGHHGAVPAGYGLRSGNVERAVGWLGDAGLCVVREARAGDVALVRPGPLQLHLMILVPGGHVHAHAGVGRVVEMPGPSPWPVIGHWRAD